MQGMINNKVWGTTKCLFKNSNFEIHRITIKKGGFCSLHCHEHKYNVFYVESGSLDIEVHKNDYKLKDITRLSNDDITNVKPNEYHMFNALEDTIAYEIYYTEPISDDIIRKSVGGLSC